MCIRDRYSTQYPGQEKQIVEYFEKNPSSLDTIRAPLIEQKVIESIISKSETNAIKLEKERREILSTDQLLKRAQKRNDMLKFLRKLKKDLNEEVIN